MRCHERVSGLCATCLLKDVRTPATVSAKYRTADAPPGFRRKPQFASVLVYVNVHTEIGVVHKCFSGWVKRPKFNEPPVFRGDSLPPAEPF